MTTLPSVAWEESGKASDSRPGLLAFPEHGHRCWFSSEGAMTVKVYPKNAYFFFNFKIITFYFQLTSNWSLNEQVHFNQNLLI